MQQYHICFVAKQVGHAGGNTRNREFRKARNFPYTKTLKDTVVFGTPRMSHQKTNSLEELSQKHNLSRGYLKRQIRAARTSLAREIEKQSDGKRSLPTEKELSSRHLCLYTTDQS